MNSYTVENLSPEQSFSRAVFLDQGFVLTAPGIAMGAAMKEALQEWGFETVQSEGEAGGDPKEAVPEGFSAETEGLSAETEATGSLESEQLKHAETVYRDLQGFVESLFAQMESYIAPDFNEMAKQIKALCDAVRKDSRYLLRVLESNGALQDAQPSYLVSHTVKSTILSIIIGSYLKLTHPRLIELGVAAILHEAGMLTLTPEIYTSTGALSKEDQKAILSHPVLGYKLLKSFDLPPAITAAALEHHERENGEGYPRRLTGEKITFYAKIIAVACSYEAQTSTRPYKMTKDSYSGMVNMLKNERKQYQDAVVRALVFSLSIYPIGLHVLLSDGRKGQVVDVNPEDPRYPLVQPQEAATAEGKIKILKTSRAGVHIIRPLEKDEAG
ncbi:phosphohydrolase [Spirochaetia bacterium]|nr:phosphohydrolase [Spirochaetia bacterium]